jgi:hypothetical protein
MSSRQNTACIPAEMANFLYSQPLSELKKAGYCARDETGNERFTSIAHASNGQKSFVFHMGALHVCRPDVSLADCLQTPGNVPGTRK